MENKLRDCAVEAALKAGKLLKEGFGTAFKISSKEGRNNLVTEYDNLSEKMIIEHIKNEFPNHSFLAEESGKSGNEKTGRVRWVIDPLDGTVNYAHTIPVFSVSIAAELDGELLAGVIYHPMLDELFAATRGGGAYLNGHRLKVSENGELDASFLVTGFPYNVNENPCNCIDHFVNIIQRGIPVRRLGSAALDLAYVAAGKFDGFWEIDLNPWDVAAGALLVQEAGGMVTQFNREKFRITDDTILATNKNLHGELADILGTCRHYCNH